MTTPDIQQNNPLHGLKLETLLNEIVDHYGWEILADAININCFKQNPSIASSLKFLRKTEWAQHKVEAFYLYQFKSLPRADDEQYELPPRQRTIPLDQKPGEPQTLWVGQFAERRAHKANRPENKAYNNSHKGAGKKAGNKTSYSSSFGSPKKTQDSTSQSQTNSSGFVNPWTDEHY